MIRVSPLLCLLTALAAFRLTRLVTKDLITENLRARIPNKSVKLYDFVTCPWCVGFWISVVCVIAAAADVRLWFWIALTLSVSAIVGILGERF